MMDRPKTVADVPDGGVDRTNGGGGNGEGGHVYRVTVSSACAGEVRA
jgi:hypothetical protein